MRTITLDFPFFISNVIWRCQSCTSHTKIIYCCVRHILSLVFCSHIHRMHVQPYTYAKNMILFNENTNVAPLSYIGLLHRLWRKSYVRVRLIKTTESVFQLVVFVLVWRWFDGWCGTAPDCFLLNLPYPVFPLSNIALTVSMRACGICLFQVVKTIFIYHSYLFSQITGTTICSFRSIIDLIFEQIDTSK